MEDFVMDIENDDALIDMAISAYHAERNLTSRSEPNLYASTVEQIHGQLVVVLRDYKDILSCYSVEAGCKLRRLAKIPGTLMI